MQKKLIATALGAFGFGALVGWAVTSDIRDNQLIKNHNEELEQLKDMVHYKTEHIFALQERLNRFDGNPFGVVSENPIVPKMQVVATGTVIPKQEVIEENEEDEIDEQINETPEETRTNLQRIIDTYAKADPQDQDFMTMFVEEDSTPDNTPPFVISQATYAWDEEGESYEKITLSYYPRDRVLLDDEEDPIEDVNRMIGWRNLTKFGYDSGDSDVVFVRNRSLRTDFEVVKDDDSQLPLHVKYGMEKEEFRANKAAGLIKLRQEDDDY